jgi:hypothetical protein
MADHTIFLIGGKDDEFGVLTLSGVADACHLSFAFRGRRIEATASDFFEAFCQIRLQLEAEALIPFCYGASLNVHPSGMSRQMSNGLLAYRLTVGSPGRIETLVRIFEQGPDVIPASVANQQSFYRGWAASLGA